MEKGLDRLEVRRRQEHFGPNIITGQKKTNPLILFLQQFNQALVYILIGAGAITCGGRGGGAQRLRQPHKFIVWTLPTNLGEGLVILAAIFAGVTLPILPIQILWINMSTAVLLGLMLAFEPREAGIMARPPRDPGLPMLTGELVFRIFFVGFLMLIGGFGLFELAELRGFAVERCRTIAVNVFIFTEIFYLFNSRSLQHSVFRIGVFTNQWVFAGVAVMIVMQLLFTYLPAANRIFQSASISALDWAFILAFAALVHLLVEVEKTIRRRGRLKKQPS